MVNIGGVGEYNHGKRNKTQLITQFQTITIPDDIAIEILSRLPHESLFKFKTVCKTWHSLFSDPSFIKLHKKNQNETLLICCSNPHLTFILQIKNPDTPLNPDHPFCNYLAPLMTLVGSINGLICLGSSPWAQSFVIWNPVTNYYKYLPRPNITYSPYTMHSISLGFCYHSPTEDYIVVRIVRFEQNGIFMSKFELYSLNSNSWRNTENVLDYLVLFKTCTIVKGKPYWWAVRDRRHFFVGFDISDNLLFTKVHGFRARNDDVGRCKLVNYKCLLAVLVDSSLSLSSLTCEFLGLGNSSQREFSERSISMFVLGCDGLWCVRLRVGFPLGMHNVIGCSINGQVVLEDRSGITKLFDMENEKIENINIVGGMNRIFTVSNYVASLVTIKGSKTGT